SRRTRDQATVLSRQRNEFQISLWKDVDSYTRYKPTIVPVAQWIEHQSPDKIPQFFDSSSLFTLLSSAPQHWFLRWRFQQFQKCQLALVPILSNKKSASLCVFTAQDTDLSKIVQRWFAKPIDVFSPLVLVTRIIKIGEGLLFCPSLLWINRAHDHILF